MTSEELEAEREEQIARGEMPRYGGKHAHLTKEEQEAFEAEGRQPSIRFRVPQNKEYKFDDIVKGEVSFDSNGIGDWVIVKKMASQLITLQLRLMITTWKFHTLFVVMIIFQTHLSNL